jgi:hypothetical protein
VDAGRFRGIQVVDGTCRSTARRERERVEGRKERSHFTSDGVHMNAMDVEKQFGRRGEESAFVKTKKMDLFVLKRYTKYRKEENNASSHEG